MKLKNVPSGMLAGLNELRSAAMDHRLYGDVAKLLEGYEKGEYLIFIEARVSPKKSSVCINAETIDSRHIRSVKLVMDTPYPCDGMPEGIVIFCASMDSNYTWKVVEPANEGEVTI